MQHCKRSWKNDRVISGLGSALVIIHKVVPGRDGQQVDAEEKALSTKPH